MQNWQATVLTQYANSPIILSLIQSFNTAIDPAANITAFYNDIWNIQTAQGYGLDVWGRIVGVNRVLTLPSSGVYFGLEEAGASAYPFGSEPFWTGTSPTTNYALSDTAFRQLILIKAFSNISNCSIQTYNTILMTLFPGRGNCYVSDTGLMNTRLTFEFLLQPYEISILKQSNAFAPPAGVATEIMDLGIPYVFGFSEAGTHAACFNNGTYFKGFE